MPNPKSAWRARLEEILADGEWHRLDDLVRAAGPLVPEGKAVRRGERERVRTRLVPGERERCDRDTAVATGRRDIIRRSLADMVSQGQATRAAGEYRSLSS